MSDLISLRCCRLRALFCDVSVAVRWRWRRFVVGRLRVLVTALLALFVAGVALSSDLHSWSRGTAFSGRAPVWGQIVVRPPVGCGAVHGAVVRLVPAGVWGVGAVLHLAARGGSPPVVRVGTDFAGRWSADAGLVAGWRYAVLVDAEACSPRLARTVEVGWFSASRVDVTLRSCRGRWNSLEFPVGD